jgi:hypothetical protein
VTRRIREIEVNVSGERRKSGSRKIAARRSGKRNEKRRRFGERKGFERNGG